MPERIAADTEGMRARVPQLAEAADVATRIGQTLQAALSSNEPLADWTDDEVTAHYLPEHQSIKEFVTQVFDLLPGAVGGDQERTRNLIDLLEQMEEQNEEEAAQAASLLSPIR